MKLSNPVHKRIILSLVAIASFLFMATAFHKIKEIGTRNTIKNLSVINNRLEKLEINLRNSDLKETCSNANTALRIIATLTGQVRGWLWVSLLEQEGEKDVSVIAQAAGISNPKRIYVMRKQLQGQEPKLFLKLLSQLLEIESSL